MTTATPVQLGDFVAVSDPSGITWRGWVCVVSTDQSPAQVNITDESGLGACSVRADSPDLTVITPADPAIVTCRACQTIDPDMPPELAWLILCDNHQPAFTAPPRSSRR